MLPIKDHLSVRKAALPVIFCEEALGECLVYETRLIYSSPHQSLPAFVVKHKMSHDLIRDKTSGLKLSFMKRVFRAPTCCTRPMFRYVLAVSSLSFALLGCQTVEPGDPDMAYGWGPASPQTAQTANAPCHEAVEGCRLETW